MSDALDPLLAPLQTDRLVIRPLQAPDLEACHRLFVDIGWVDPREGDQALRERRRSWLLWTIDGYRELGRLHQPRYGERAVVRRSDGRLVGLVGLVPSTVPMGQLDGLGGRRGAGISAEFGLFWAVSPDLQGQGLATEAAAAFMAHVAAVLRLARVVATTEHENAASIAVMRKLGMRVLRNPYPEPHWCQVVGVADFPAAAPPG